MLRRLSIRTRLRLAFGVILLMTALLVGIGGFGLHVSDKALRGITQKLIPASNISMAARTHLLQSKTATSTLVAAIFNKEGLARARKDWDAAQAGLDKAMDDFGAMATEPQSKDNLAKFRSLVNDYRKAVKPVADKLVENLNRKPAEHTCSDCTLAGMQIQQASGGGINSQHPIELIHQAYGLDT